MKRTDLYENVQNSGNPRNGLLILNSININELAGVVMKKTTRFGKTIRR